MFFSEDMTIGKPKTKAKALREANKVLSKEVDSCFEQELNSMKKELMDAGIPEERHARILTELKQNLQVEAIKKFKEILTQEEIIARENRNRNVL